MSAPDSRDRDHSTIDERKKLILEATINQYIETAEPVGSKTLTEHRSFNLSAATIRNELNELERHGYLSHPHTSSGRVPTDKGYRFYVDALMRQGVLSGVQRQRLYEQIRLIGQNVHEALAQVSEILSSAIDYTTIVATPDIFQETLKTIHMVLLDLDRVLIVLLHTAGVTNEFLFHLPEKLEQEELNKISRLLTDKLSGRTLAELDQQTLAGLIADLPHHPALLKALSDQLALLRHHHQRPGRLMSKGVSKMLRMPEFQSIELTHKVLSTLEESKVLLGLLSQYLESEQSNVLIGSEAGVDGLKECSLVISPVKAENTPVGVIGVLGPKRMAYPYIVPMIQTVSQMISDYLSYEQPDKSSDQSLDSR